MKKPQKGDKINKEENINGGNVVINLKKVMKRLCLRAIYLTVYVTVAGKRIILNGCVWSLIREIYIFMQYILLLPATSNYKSA